MVPQDRGRTPDSVRRRAAMEAAVRVHLGAITPEVAASILRDRSSSRYINDSIVANLFVMNSLVVEPASRTRGRPKVSGEIRGLIARMAPENFLWGAPRIHGELLMLGFSVSQYQ